MQSHLISRRSLIRSSLIGLACSAAPAISAAEKDDWTVNSSFGYLSSQRARAID